MFGNWLSKSTSSLDDMQPVTTPDAAATGTIGIMLAGNEVEQVVPGLPADLSGRIKQGDVVLSVNGVEVSPMDAAAALKGAAGTRVFVRLARGSATYEVWLTRQEKFSTRSGQLLASAAGNPTSAKIETSSSALSSSSNVLPPPTTATVSSTRSLAMTLSTSALTPSRRHNTNNYLPRNHVVIGGSSSSAADIAPRQQQQQRPTTALVRGDSPIMSPASPSAGGRASSSDGASSSGYSSSQFNSNNTHNNNNTFNAVELVLLRDQVEELSKANMDLKTENTTLRGKAAWAEELNRRYELLRQDVATRNAAAVDEKTNEALQQENENLRTEIQRLISKVEEITYLKSELAQENMNLRRQLLAIQQQQQQQQQGVFALKAGPPPPLGTAPSPGLLPSYGGMSPTNAAAAAANIQTGLLHPRTPSRGLLPGGGGGGLIGTNSLIGQGHAIATPLGGGGGGGNNNNNATLAAVAVAAGGGGGGGPLPPSVGSMRWVTTGQPQQQQQQQQQQHQPSLGSEWIGAPGGGTTPQHRQQQQQQQQHHHQQQQLVPSYSRGGHWNGMS